MESIPDWVYEKKLSQSELYAFRNADLHYVKREARYLVGQNYNRYLKQVASDNGVKLGNVKRTAGIQNKLNKKGVQFFDKATFSGSKGWEVKRYD